MLQMELCFFLPILISISDFLTHAYKQMLTASTGKCGKFLCFRLSVYFCNATTQEKSPVPYINCEEEK